MNIAWKVAYDEACDYGTTQMVHRYERVFIAGETLESLAERFNLMPSAQVVYRRIHRVERVGEVIDHVE